LDTVFRPPATLSLTYVMAKATVTAVLRPSGSAFDTILLTKRAIEPFRDHWCLPGGHIDQWEKAEDAVHREVHEETGLEMHSPCFIGYCDEIFPEYNFHAEVLIFCGAAEGSLQAQPEEVSALQWFTLAEARSFPLAFNHNAVLERYEAYIDSL
jgi:8-oxo-dGTP diphosphatase